MIQATWLFRMLSIVLIALALAACSDPNASRKQLLQGEMQLLESNYALQSQQLLAARQRVSDISLGLQRHKAELADLERRVSAFLMNHKMATAAILAGAAGGVVAIDSNSEFSDELQGAGAVVGVVALIWAANNMEEVIEVASTLAQAEQASTVIKARISEDSQTLSRVNQQTAVLQQQLAAVQADYEQRRVALQNLQ
jgi:hypothetical protein